MKFIRRITGKPVKVIAMALLGAASLVACGSSSYIAPEPVPPATDAFVTAISALVATSPDDTEPVAIDSFVATAPEDTEPQPLG